jgi:hypothetical protein
LNRATAFAARICTVDGALPENKGWYSETLDDWKEQDAGKRGK